MIRKSGLMVLAGVIGLAGLLMAGGSKQYSVSLTGSGTLDSGTVTIYICSDSLCQTTTELGMVTTTGIATVTATFSGPSSAKAFAYAVSESDNGRSSTYTSPHSPNPLGVPVSIGRDLTVVVGSAGGSTGGKKK